MAPNVTISRSSTQAMVTDDPTTFSLEEVTTLNGGAVVAQKVQRIIAALRTADSTAVDLPGDATFGLDVDVTRSVLPTGASTETTLAAVLAAVDTLEALIAAQATLAQTQPVSLASVPSHAVTNAGTFATQNTPAVATAEAQTSVASSASSGTLLAANAARKAASIYNDSTAILYVTFGATATSANCKLNMAAGSYFELPQPVYPGVIAGIWASANGSARIAETV